MFQYRQILARMRQGDTDREIARTRLMGRRKAAELRELAWRRRWLARDSTSRGRRDRAGAGGGAPGGFHRLQR